MYSVITNIKCLLTCNKHIHLLFKKIKCAICEITFVNISPCKKTKGQNYVNEKNSHKVITNTSNWQIYQLCPKHWGHVWKFCQSDGPLSKLGHIKSPIKMAVLVKYSWTYLYDQFISMLLTFVRLNSNVHWVVLFQEKNPWSSQMATVV